MQKKNYVPWMAAAALAASLAIALPAFAQTTVGVTVGNGTVSNGANGGRQFPPRSGAMASGIFGSVTAINGTTLTVTNKGMMRPRPEPEQDASTTAVATTQLPTVYTVDASNAKIYKGDVSSTVSIGSIATGDNVFVQGTVTGTNVVATVIRDGVVVPGRMGGGPGMGKGFEHSSSSAPVVSPITGNGEPVVGGAITAISGTTLTVTNTSNVTYTIDTSNAKIVKDNTTISASALATGDNVIVQGTVNGTSVVASSVIDQGTKPTNGSSSSTTGEAGSGSHGGFSFGFFGAIGGFFQHLFGF